MRKFTEDNWKIDMSSCVSNECTHTFIYPEHLRIKQIDEDVMKTIKAAMMNVMPTPA